jgi:hypothetical protein
MRVLFCVAALLGSINALASTGSGKIIGVVPYSVGSEEILFIKVESTSSDTPACNTTHRYAIKNSSAHFNFTQSVALAAFMSGTPVLVRGKNTCDVYDNSESFTHLCIGSTPC